MSNTTSFFFYDYETFGVDPRRDRIAQFGGVRTDLDFNIIDEPINLYCQQSPDYLPDPEAILVTGITPQLCNERGVNEATFARLIHEQFTHPNSCILGYNNIRFDDEATRFLFYRNFYDPYAYSWQNGNTRWDLIDVVRATYALRPEGIEWPIDEEGRVSLKLEALTAANGLEHQDAHDALSDVYATIALAKLLKSKQPRLFQYYFSNRRKEAVEGMLRLHQPEPLLHISGMFGAKNHYLSVITPLTPHPTNRNATIVVDLRKPITPLLTQSADELRRLLYTREEDYNEGESRPPIKLLHHNRAPILAPLGVLRDAPPEHTEGLDRATIVARHNELMAHRDPISQKLSALYQPTQRGSAQLIDPEEALYDGFFSHDDRAQMDRIPTLPPDQIMAQEWHFTDARVEPLLFRYRAKNYPESLNEVEQKIWQTFSRTRANNDRLRHEERLKELQDHYHDHPQYSALLAEIADYYAQ